MYSVSSMVTDFISSFGYYSCQAMVASVPGQLPAQDMAVLHEMQADVLHAYRELQAAEAATMAVAQARALGYCML
jgi:hypothetical protein